MATRLGMTTFAIPTPTRGCRWTLSHEKFVLDHNRCILCTRCVRVCAELEGAHVWDIASRGVQSNMVSDLNQPWG